MGLALVVIEERAGGAVHLGNDDALRAVDDEGAVDRHQRHIAHVDVLLLDVANIALLDVFLDVEDDEPQGHLERRRVGHAALLALLHIILRRFELIAHEVKLGAVRKILDREDRFQDRLNTAIHPLFRRRIHLQKLCVGTLLHLDEIRHRRDRRNTAESASSALAARKNI